MSARPAITLVVITARWCFRGDFSSPVSEPLGFWHTPRSTDGSNHASAVCAVLALGGRAGARVWVLSDDVLVQSLDIPRHQTAGLTAEQLAQALAFEIEPFSSLISSEAAVGFHATEEPGGKTRYRIVEMTRNDREAVEAVIRQSGGRLVGMSHPGELPQRPNSDDETVLRKWITDCAGKLETSPRDLPLIPPSERRLQRQDWMRIAVAAELAVVLLGLSMGGCLSRYRGGLRHEFEDVQQEAQASMARANRNTQLKQTIATLQENRARLNREWSELQVQRRVLAELLRALALERPDNVVIERIRTGGAEDLEITGLCLNAQSADDMAAMLSSRGNARGWIVHPLKKQACRLLDNGGRGNLRGA